MRIAYVCEGGGKLGWGHVGRGRAFTEAAAGEATIVLGSGFDEIATWCVVHEVALPLAPWSAPGLPFEIDGCPWDVVVVDHYTLEASWITALAERVPVLVLDDWMRDRLTATTLVNANVGARAADYPHVQVESWLLGPAYAQLRAEVRQASGAFPLDGPASRLLVTLGGSDPEGRTAEIVEALTLLPWYRNAGRITVVLGPSYAGERPWERWDAGRSAGLEVVRQPRDFVRRIAEADVVVCGASTTTYELAYLGRPFSPVALVDNQARVGSAWAALGAGTGCAVWEDGWLSRLVADAERLLLEGPLRRDLGRRVREHVDGRGAARLLEACRAALAARAGAGAGSAR